MAPNTFAKVSTPLGDEALMLAGLTGQEALGQPFKYELELFSLDTDIKLTDIMAQPVTVQVEMEEGRIRYINGIVTRFAWVGNSGRYAVYRATLRPWLWLLTRHMDSRIFQNKTVPDVIKEVFRGHNFSDFDHSFGRGFREWEYIAQYRESSFNFVSRLMEQEGIYYYFKHKDGQHVLYMTDFYSGHQAQEGYEEIPYFPPTTDERRRRDHIDSWRIAQEIQPGTFSLNDFDFKKPRADLRNVLKTPENLGAFEVYDYPGEYDQPKDGEQYTRIRMEQATSEYELGEGHGNARGLTVGSHFVMTGHPRNDQNREYLVTAATFTLELGAFQSDHRADEGPTYRCAFQALEANTPYRPARSTPKPEIPGPQTAIVVGGPGDEIYTDSYGRVKVKFHWDRAENKHETSSCWIRVAQIWAGTRWGAMHIPRVGQEVIVEFLEGDPDRPIITGRVYNADNMPPYDLPGNKTQSGIKSRSSKGGTMNNFNELRFEDKKGDEQLYMQAEKNMDTLVKNDQTLSVAGNRTKTVEKDEKTEVHQNRTESVTLNETIEIGVDRKEIVGGSETINIVGPRTETVLGAETITIGGARTETVGAAETITIGAARTTTIAAADTLLVGGGYTMAVAGAGTMGIEGALSQMVGGSHSTTIVGASSLDVGKNSTVSVSGARTQDIGKDETLKVGKKLVINVVDEITIKTGDASITMKKNGDIVIKGKNIQLKGSGKINAKADGNMVLKASKIGQN